LPVAFRTILIVPGQSLGGRKRPGISDRRRRLICAVQPGIINVAGEVESCDAGTRVRRAKVPVVAQAPLDRSPGGGVQRDRLGPPAKPDATGGSIDVAGGQAAQFFVAGVVDEGEQPGQGFVRVDAAAGPAADQALLEADQGSGTLVAAGLSHCQYSCNYDSSTSQHCACSAGSRCWPAPTASRMRRS